MDVAELEARKREMGSRSFSSQFLQDPLPATGSTIRASWIQRFDYDKPPSFDKVIAAVDTASGTSVSNDWSVIAKIGCSKNGFYIIDVWSQRVEFPQLIKRIAALNEETPRPSTVYIEAASSGIQIVQTLKQSTRLPNRRRSPRKEARSRVEATTGLWESGKVYLPREAPWLNDAEQMLTFLPESGKWDDVTDAVTLGLSPMRTIAKSGAVLYFRRERARRTILMAPTKITAPSAKRRALTWGQRCRCDSPVWFINAAPSTARKTGRQ